MLRNFKDRYYKRWEGELVAASLASSRMRGRGRRGTAFLWPGGSDTHELIHLIHPHHRQPFYELLETLMPDWRKRKQRLERTLS